MRYLQKFRQLLFNIWYSSLRNVDCSAFFICILKSFGARFVYPQSNPLKICFVANGMPWKKFILPVKCFYLTASFFIILTLNLIYDFVTKFSNIVLIIMKWFRMRHSVCDKNSFGDLTWRSVYSLTRETTNCIVFLLFVNKAKNHQKYGLLFFAEIIRIIILFATYIWSI